MNEIHIGSVTDARKYREQLAARRPDRDPAVTRWRTCKRCVLLMLLSTSFLIYYMVSINVEILSLPELHVSVPVKLSGPDDRGRLTAL